MSLAFPLKVLATIFVFVEKRIKKLLSAKEF